MIVLNAGHVLHLEVPEIFTRELLKGPKSAGCCGYLHWADLLEGLLMSLWKLLLVFVSAPGAQQRTAIDGHRGTAQRRQPARDALAGSWLSGGLTQSETPSRRMARPKQRHECSAAWASLTYVAGRGPPNSGRHAPGLERFLHGITNWSAGSR